MKSSITLSQSNEKTTRRLHFIYFQKLMIQNCIHYDQSQLKTQLHKTPLIHFKIPDRNSIYHRKTAIPRDKRKIMSPNNLLQLNNYRCNSNDKLRSLTVQLTFTETG